VNANAVLARLKSLGTERRKRHAALLGIPTERAFGVSIGDLRRLAKSLGTRHELALALWRSGIHDARLLAVLIADAERMTDAAIERWLADVRSWDLCDHICADLVRDRPNADRLVRTWAKDERLYFRRAAFATIAGLAVHRPDLPAAAIERYLDLIRAGAGDERDHVKKGVSWALREIGKMNFAAHDLAVALTADLVESGDKSARWVGRDAMRELETLVAVPERRRLLSSKSKMGKKTARRLA